MGREARMTAWRCRASMLRLSFPHEDRRGATMSASYRVEKDTMGEMQIPAEAYWGAQSARAKANFPVSGQAIPSLVIRALGMLKGAAAAANLELGLLDRKIADAIQKAAAEVAEGTLDAEFVVDVFQTGSGTSSNMNANEVIANRASEVLGQGRGSKAVHPNDH